MPTKKAVKPRKKNPLLKKSAAPSIQPDDSPIRGHRPQAPGKIPAAKLKDKSAPVPKTARAADVAAARSRTPSDSKPGAFKKKSLPSEPLPKAAVQSARDVKQTPILKSRPVSGRPLPKRIKPGRAAEQAVQPPVESSRPPAEPDLVYAPEITGVEEALLQELESMTAPAGLAEEPAAGHTVTSRVESEFQALAPIRPGTGAEAKPETEPEQQPETRITAEPNGDSSGSGPESAAGPAAETETEPDTQPGTEMETETEMELRLETEAEFGPEDFPKSEASGFEKPLAPAETIAETNKNSDSWIPDVQIEMPGDREGRTDTVMIEEAVPEVEEAVLEAVEEAGQMVAETALVVNETEQGLAPDFQPEPDGSIQPPFSGRPEKTPQPVHAVTESEAVVVSRISGEEESALSVYPEAGPDAWSEPESGQRLTTVAEQAAAMDADVLKDLILSAGTKPRTEFDPVIPESTFENDPADQNRDIRKPEAMAAHDLGALIFSAVMEASQRAASAPANNHAGTDEPSSAPAAGSGATGAEFPAGVSEAVFDSPGLMRSESHSETAGDSPFAAHFENIKLPGVAENPISETMAGGEEMMTASADHVSAAGKTAARFFGKSWLQSCLGMWRESSQRRPLVVGFIAGLSLSVLLAAWGFRAYSQLWEENRKLKTQAAAETRELKTQLENAQIENEQFRTGNKRLSELMSSFGSTWNQAPERPRYMRAGQGFIVYWEEALLWRRYFLNYAQGSRGPMVRYSKYALKRNFAYFSDLTPGVWRFSVTALNKEGRETAPSEPLVLRMPLLQ